MVLHKQFDLNRSFVTIENLLEASDQQLKNLFRQCEPFNHEELGGSFRGIVINGNWVWGNKFGLSITNEFWNGKVFFPEKKEGENIVSFGDFNSSAFKFITNVEDSIRFEGKVFSLRYEYKDSLNPWPIRSIVDEMRKVRDGLYLGTGNIQLLGTFYLFDWYILFKK